MNRHAGIAVLGAILLMALLLTVGHRPGGGDAARPETGPDRPAISAIPQAGAPSALPRRKSTIEAKQPAERDFDPWEAWDTGTIVAHFMVPAGVFESTDIHSAVEALESLYAQFGGKQLEIEAQAAHPGFAVKFEHGNISFRQLLEMIAALGNCEVRISDGAVALAPKPESARSAEQVTRRVPVPPDFCHPDHSERDPFAPDTPAPPDPQVAAEKLAAYGFVFGEGTALEYDPATSELIVTHSAGEIERIRSLTPWLAHSAPVSQVRLSHRILSASKAGVLEPQTLADGAELEAFLEDLSAREQVEVVSAPTIVARAGQRAQFEMIREFIYPTAREAGGVPKDFETRPLGVQIPVEAQLIGLDRVQLLGATEFTALAGQRLDEVSRAGGLPPTAEGQPFVDQVYDDADFHTHANDFEGQLLDGNTALLLAAEEDGAAVFHMLTARRIGPDGNPLLE